MENQHFSTSGYLPNGMRVFFEVPFTDAATAYDTALQFTNMLLSRGLLINAPGLEDGEQKEQASCFIRSLKTNDDGTETNVIHLYPMNAGAQYKFLTVYLDTADDIAAFEQAAGVTLASVPQWVADAPPQKDSANAKKYFVHPSKPLVAIHKANPRYEEGNKKPKRLFVRWDVTQQHMDAPAPVPPQPQPASAVVTPTPAKPESRAAELQNELVAIERITPVKRLGEQMWEGIVHIEDPKMQGFMHKVVIRLWKEDKKALEQAGHEWLENQPVHIPVYIDTTDRNMIRIDRVNIPAPAAAIMTPHAPPEARHPSLDENPPVNPFNGAKAQPQAAAPETAQKPTSKEPDWFKKTLKAQFGLFKTYAQEHIYGTNLFHMKGSLKKHGVVDAKDKLTPAWENKTIGEAVKLLNDLRQHEQMEKAS